MTTSSSSTLHYTLHQTYIPHTSIPYTILHHFIVQRHYVRVENKLEILETSREQTTTFSEGIATGKEGVKLEEIYLY